MTKLCSHLMAKDPKSGITLVDHTEHVLAAAMKIADYLGLDERDKNAVRWGAILHDMGKASPTFQQRLKQRKGFLDDPYRHELGSLFFIPLVPEELRDDVVDMIVAHHRSPKKDAREEGIVDLDQRFETEDRGGKVFEMHFADFEKWSAEVLEILRYFELPTHPISRGEAFNTYYDIAESCRKKPRGYSRWKGILMAADHLASSVNFGIYNALRHSFFTPDLSWYHDSTRQSDLYPLSTMNADSKKPHSLVIAPTGAGKTDFLLRRCRGRVFYILPFQASINAMFERFRDTIPGVRMLHAASRLILSKNPKIGWSELAIQDKAGAPLKVLTPYQVASIAFGTKGYEAMLVDIAGCDVIMDEIHTYTDISRAIVLRLIEILVAQGCRVHVGTATMPTELSEKVLLRLGENETDITKLSPAQLDAFDRHIIHKKSDVESTFPVIADAIARDEKVLFVVNQVQRAQELYEQINELFPDAQTMLIHSRYKRGDRAQLETQLKNDFEAGADGCIVIATQVVEVSLDISFDVMITEAAPLDALVQRFGRVNRRRNADTIGEYKPIYVLAPHDDPKENRPYDDEIVCKSYDALPDDSVLRERDVQGLIDSVFAESNEASIDLMSIFREGKFLLPELEHRRKSVLLDAMEIETACCILQSQMYEYQEVDFEERAQMEIPVAFKSIVFRELERIQRCGSNPFIVPDESYDAVRGLQLDKTGKENYSTSVML